MATRFYLPATGTAPLGSLAVDSQWELSDNLERRPCDVVKSNTSLTQKSANWTNASTQQWVWVQFQSKKLAAGYSWTTSDTVSMVIKVAEAAAQVDSHLCYVIRVVSGDGATIRGTIGAYLTTSTEYPTSLASIATRIHDARTTGASNFSSQAGDRIIIEIGHHGVTPTLNTVYHNYGDPSETSDYALTADLTTDLCPWVELSRDVSFVLSDNQPAYSKGRSTASATPQSAFTQGQNVQFPASDNQYAYTKGKSDVLDNQNVYIQGKLDATPDSQNAYTKGGIGVLDSKSGYTRGKLDATPDNQPVYTEGISTLQIDNQIAYTKGISVLQIDNQSVYTEGILFERDNQSAYTEGYTVGGPSSSSRIAFTMGLGGNNLSPDGDVTVSGLWWNELNSPNNLYQSIDETTPNDSDYIWDTNPTTGHYYECSLSNPTGIPGSGQITIFYRGKDSSNSGKSRANVQLRQGGTIIASGTQILTSTPQTYYFQLSESERANITDWNDLRIRILPQIS